MLYEIVVKNRIYLVGKMQEVLAQLKQYEKQCVTLKEFINRKLD
ncbi:hypothetical protein Tfer_0447 [Thermincola ferriacetica]|uniref:Uncharacterized protein n=2 Tax=Thermincola TaxID=278993 RepID=D5X7F0_THEPJ|nr:hypothetical protein TherJR_1671 [Thermincola potens JR]KNZ70768.1 hypothetical protein Tfer_0447 [Thermincola ferriacetica]